MIRLLIIAPDMMIGSLLSEAFKREADFAVMGVLTMGETFRGAPEAVDVVALHADAHAGDLLTAIRRLRDQLPAAKIVLIHPPGVQDIQINALEVGAAGYVGQDQTVNEMVQVIRTVHDYGSAITPGLAQTLVERVTELHRRVALHSQPTGERAGGLTEREWEVLELVSDNLSNAEIAERLFISVGTVKNHVHNILVKLKADNREQASYWYRWQRQYQSTGMAGDGSSASDQGQLTACSLLAASRLPTLRAMIQERLALFCRQLGWPVGHVFLLDEATMEMVATGIWHLSEPERFEPFRAATEALRLRAREEVIGHILFSPEPTWVAEVSEHPDFRRAQIAREVGIRSALFLPFLDGILIGAFEFYATERDRPDPATVSEIIRSSRQMGHELEASRRR